jgi:hypothetical protein
LSAVQRRTLRHRGRLGDDGSLAASRQVGGRAKASLRMQGRTDGMSAHDTPSRVII